MVRRRRYLISRLQVRILLHLLLYAAAFVGGVALLVFLPVALEMNDPDAPAQQQAKASAAFLALDSRVWPAVFALTCLIGSHAVLLTHRVAGPLYRFRQVMRDAARGDLSLRARIRRKDLLHDEADVLNELLETLDRRNVRASRTLQELRGALAELDGLVDSGAGATELARVHEVLRELDDHLGSAPPETGPDPATNGDDVPAPLPSAEATDVAQPSGEEPA